jgi:hypothetical protein
MIEHATPPAEFEKFRESALVIDASLPPLESHFRPLAARVQLLLSQARKEEQHRISPALAVEPNPKHGSENVSVDKIGPLRGQAAPLVAGLPPHAIDDAAIDIAVRIAVEVLSEIHTPASRIAGRDARVHPRSPLAAREQMPIAPARPKVAYPSTRPISPRSPQKHTKRNFALVVAGLSVIAFGAGALFSKQILGLLDAIAEYIRHLGIGTGLI